MAKDKVRAPRQQRSLHKVELILEAAMRLIDRQGLGPLTTNAVAATAGVSIGTLYQYFPNKEAILEELASREAAAMGNRVLAALDDPAPLAPQDRIAAIVRAVVAGYGERLQVHRIVMEYSLSRGSNRLAPLIDRIIGLLGIEGRPTPTLSAADAFVLTHAFVGVMRAMILRPDDAPDQGAIEQAMARLILNFAEGKALL